MISEVTPPTRADVRVRAVFRGKRPKAVTLDDGIRHVLNDRTVVWVGGRQVQYDGPEIKPGQKRPIVALDRFLTWAGYEIPHK